MIEIVTLPLAAFPHVTGQPVTHALGPNRCTATRLKNQERNERLAANQVAQDRKTGLSKEAKQWLSTIDP